MLNVVIFFTYAENLVGNLFVKIAGRDARALIDDFVLRPSSAKYAERLLAAAAPRVSEEDMLSLRTVMRMFIDCYEERNVFAHWICGISMQVPEGILMVDPHDLWRRQVAFHAQLYERPANFGQAIGMLIDKAEIYVYEMQHFDEIDTKISALITAVTMMYNIQLIQDARVRSLLRPQLYAIPQFQRARADLPAARGSKKTKSLQQRFARLRRQLRRAFREFFGRDRP